jgi:hypothetical protein
MIGAAVAILRVGCVGMGSSGWNGDTDPGYYSNNLKSLSTARDNSSAS